MIASQQRWRPDEDAVIIATNSTLSVREQAARLQRSYDATVVRRQRLIQAGLLDTANRKMSRHWTQQQEQELIALLREGYTLRQIARRLDRSYNAIVCRCEDLGGADWIRRPKDGLQVRTIDEVSKLFGVREYIVIYWLNKGWIEGRRNSKRWGCETLIADVSLVGLLSRRETWLTWKPERLTDPDWKDQALWERKRATGAWLSLKQAAQRCSGWPKTLWRAIRTGNLPATRQGHFWFVWSADLDTWVQEQRVCVNELK